MDTQVQDGGERLVACTSHADDPGSAVAELVAGIAGRELAGGLLFCSQRYPRDELARELAEALPGVALVGCTSAGELTDRGYDTDSLLLIGFPASDFSMSALRFDDLDNFDPQQAQGAIRQLVAGARLDHGAAGDLHQVAMVFVDGLSHREEILTMTAQHALGDVQLIGGSSGDDLNFAKTGVFHEGRFHEDAAVIAVLTSRRPMHVFCANHYQPGPAKMVITEADPETRTVYEINAAPASEEYRRLAGSPAEKLDVHFFAAHPPMVRTGGQYHVRSIQSANPDGSLTFYCAIDTGVVLTIGEPVDRVAWLRDLFGKVGANVGEIDHIIGFDCVLNRLDAEDRQIARALSALYVENNVLGFNTYGEQFLAAHMNQTFSGLAIGR
ncbi:FIST N-terminal domain-containing protein [Novosphingobium mangrovi (ex Huang et al. 2023)]|uniref:FIST C-terminal domain-containing protein n=1 Tax=Novosphingobium mangrovi (ex Huang et al. 2023) TaxID=2976432 RepID=A0ABT2I1U5_9SPHN|nr:FIST N-terminal domain-containing protein [Novosphingobium mangrovi (ex Huang et al. 2023)]MCT2398770.1 FIST C-terminal domain-containing protein [Novosphingobium mangrovi (ex Huang et al. 2023)]